MQRGTIIVSLAFLLGCSGIAESLVELISGADIEIEGDQVVMKNADGTTNVITQGDAAVVPDDFPIPAPPGDLRPDSVVDSQDGGARTVSYRLADDADTEAMLAHYQQWFADQGIETMSDSKNMAGTRTAAIAGSRGKEVYAVTLTEMLGTRMLSLTVTPR